MFLRVKIINPKDSNIENMIFPSTEILTNSIEKFKKWCFNNRIYIYVPERSIMKLNYNSTFKWIRLRYDLDDEKIKKLIKRWGYYNSECDDLSFLDRIKYRIYYRVGKFEKLLPL